MSAGDIEHPISFLFEYEEAGEHVHVHVRAGLKGDRASCGRLTMTRDEWNLIRTAFAAHRLTFERESVQLYVDGPWVDALPFQFLPVEGMPHDQ